MSEALPIPRATVSTSDLGGLRMLPLRHIMASLSCGSLEVTTPDGRRVLQRAPRPGPEASIRLHRWRALSRLFLGGDVAFAEAYGDGDWSSPDLAALVALVAMNGPSFDRRLGATLLWRLTNRVAHLCRANSRSGAARNIMAHYDLGNEFFASWLDAGMTYSSGLYDDTTTTLEEAQTAKLDRAIALLEPEAGQSVLEIGIGWGGLAEHLLARHDVDFTGITLSPEQLAWARHRMAASDHLPRARLLLQDYRDTDGRFDRIVSIEMLEAVGEAYWPTFFQTLRDRLAPGGIAVLQVITIAEDRFADYRRRPDFIQCHIFPGGMLPTPGIIAREAAAAGLRLDHQERFGASYARTLADWQRRFLDARPAIAGLGFDERFQRLWQYYLAYCEGGFRAGAIDVGFYRFRHAGETT